MVDQLVSLLQRQLVAMELVEARLRTLELLVAADEQRFVAAALDELEDASERLAALELGRALTLDAAGFPPDVRAEDLLDAADEPTLVSGFRQVVDELRAVSSRVAAARDRTHAVTAPMASRLQTRLAAAGAYVGG